MHNRILITGGSGSFGQAMTIWLLANTDAIICILSRDEHKQERMGRDITQMGFDIERVRFFIGDVRDKTRLKKAITHITHVIHAAALKIIPSCEYNVSECKKTNIDGTENIVDVCAFSNTVEKFLLISTDKAVLPINVYGRCKSIAESIVTSAEYNYGKPSCRFMVIRLGNVISSNGSVMPLFSKFKERGESIPVTDPNMTRFFIPLLRAVEFAWDALLTGQSGEIWIPKMKAVKIMDLAKKFGSTHIIGIRPGEKIHEDLISEYESSRVDEFLDKWIIHSESIQSGFSTPIRSCNAERWDLDELIKIGTNGTC